MLRRGVRESPELKRGLGFTVIVSLGVTVTTLVTPVLVQKVFDNGFTGGFRATYVYSICAFALVLVLLAFVAARAAARRLVRAAEEALMVLARAHVRAHPPALDRRAVRGEAGRLRGARDRGRGRAAAVHGVGGHRVAHLVRAGARRARPDARLLVAAHAGGGAARDPAAAGGGLDAVEAHHRLQHRAHARRRDALGGLRVGDGRGGRACLRPGGADRPQGEARDRRAVPRRGRDALPGRHALAHVVDLLRGGALRGDRAGRHLRTLVGPHVRAGHRVPVPRRHLPARVHRPARGLRRDADRDRRVAQDPGGPRPAGRDRRALARRGAAARRALRRGAGRALRLPDGRRGAARHLARGPGGRAHGDRGRDRDAARPPS